MNICFVTVNYNNSDITDNYLSSIRDLRNDNKIAITTIIVDNSTQADEKMKLVEIALRYDNTIIVNNEYNNGYFGGLNTGLDLVDKSVNDFVVVSNNDIRFEENLLLSLFKLEWPSKSTVIAPRIITTDGLNQNPHMPTKCSSLKKVGFSIYFTNYYLGTAFRTMIKTLKAISRNFIKPKTKSQSDINLFQKIYAGHGSCYILMKDFFSSHDRLDDSVFLWGEEVLLANQVVLAGKDIIYCNQLTVFHDESSSSSKLLSKTAYDINRKSYRIYKNYL